MAVISRSSVVVQSEAGKGYGVGKGNGTRRGNEEEKQKDPTPPLAGRKEEGRQQRAKATQSNDFQNKTR